MNNVLECAICKKNSGTGISILNKFICDECEKTLVNVDINDNRYEMYKDMIKRNIYGDIILKSSIR